MENLNVTEAADKIKRYLNRNTGYPYFVISDDVKKSKELKKLLVDFKSLYISDFCTDDSPVDADFFIEKLNSLTKNVVIFGLGEYIYFTGQENILRMLQDTNFNRKIIFFCRGIANFLENLAEEDAKFRANHICKLDGRETFSVVKYNPDMNIDTDAKNFSELLKFLASGRNFVTVKTNLPILNVREINTFYDAIKNRKPHFTAPPDALNEDQWREYFFDENCEGYPPEHWRTFAAGFNHKISNSYLRFVYNRSADYETYGKNLFFALFDVDDEKLFEDFYLQRKAAVKNISSPYLAEYLLQLKNFPDALKYLTDNTAEERRAMIQAVQGKEKIPDTLTKNYSAIKDYLTDYAFGDDEITAYFRRYKKIKLCNVDDENFKALVRELATKRPYNKFETRQSILDKFNDNTKLYWLDALGIEFSGYIKARATLLELSTKIEIARADLPTLTSHNKNFYEDWRGEKFDKNQQLDELKHSPENFDSSGKCSAPSYIDDELSIIDKVLIEIKNSLANHFAEKIILTSDHGASRLAVMYGRENKFKMHSDGEHGGRCCPINPVDEKPNCATEENGYWVSANYDRFTGGRLSSVEVHGGATLEEVLVPVIEFSLNEEFKWDAEEKISEPSKKSDDAFDFLLD